MHVDTAQVVLRRTDDVEPDQLAIARHCRLRLNPLSPLTPHVALDARLVAEPLEIGRYAQAGSPLEKVFPVHTRPFESSRAEGVLPLLGGLRVPAPEQLHKNHIFCSHEPELRTRTTDPPLPRGGRALRRGNRYRR